MFDYLYIDKFIVFDFNWLLKLGYLDKKQLIYLMAIFLQILIH